MSLTRKKWLLAIAVMITAMRAILSAKLGLGDDEAYYWEWSRYLELSYYDHPGMTAWMIKVGTMVFGDTPFGVRVFGLATNALSGILLWKLGVRLFGERAAAFGIVFYLFAPIFSLGGMLMVPDAPMGMAWMAVMYLSWGILGQGENRWSTWLCAGALLGLGLISKYTIVLLALSLVLLLLSEKSWRTYFSGARFWSAVILAALFCLPIIVWNVHYDWPTLKFHLHDRQTGGGGANLARWGQFFATQAFILSPALFLMCIACLVAAVWRWRDRRWRFLFLMSAPTFALFCAQALFAEFKPHWPAPAYTILFIGVGAMLLEMSRPWRVLVIALIFVIVAPLNILFYAGTIHPMIPKVARWFAPNAPWDPKFDPTNDLFGWDKAVAAARMLREEEKAKGGDAPFLSSSRYQLASQLAFVSGERVWRVTPGKDQYSFWQTPESWRPLVGHSSIFITDNRFERDPRGDGVFESCEQRPPVEYFRGDELARRFDIWLCRGFRGFR